MKLAKIIVSVEALGILGNMDLPIKTAVKLKKIMREVQPIIDIFSEKEKTLMEKFGEINEEKTQYLFPMPGSLFEYKEARIELLEADIDLDMNMIHIDDLGDDITTLKANMLVILDWVLDTSDKE